VKTKVNQCRLYGTENHITQLGLDNSSAKLIPENSIIIAMYGDGKTAGRVALNKVPVTTNQACCNLILNKQKANYDFVFYNLMGRYDELVSKKTGSGQQNLNGKIIKEIEIDLPSLPEQKAIASVLSSLDDKIDLLHRQNKTLEAMAETLFRQWFIEEAKEDWDEVTVSSLFEVRDGTHDSPKQSPIGYPLVTSKHIGDGVLDFDSCYLISSDDYDKVNARSKVETGDILLSMIGTLGRTYLECDEVNYAIKNIGLFKTSQNPVWKYFIYLWLNSVQGKQFVDEHKVAVLKNI
jgi:type I restriction enzyme S subunit